MIKETIIGIFAALGIVFVTGIISCWIDEIKEKHYKKKHPDETYENVYNLIESVKWHLDKIQKDVKLMAKNEQATDKTEEIETP